MKYLIGLLVVVALVYGGMMYSQKPATPTTASDENMVVVNLTGDKFRFSQSEIKVKQGDKVKVILTAMDMPHDFDIDALNVNGPVAQPGETSIVEFTASQVGQFEYFCSVGQHRANGMVGTLVVE